MGSIPMERKILDLFELFDGYPQAARQTWFKKGRQAEAWRPRLASQRLKNYSDVVTAVAGALEGNTAGAAASS